MLHKIEFCLTIIHTYIQSHKNARKLLKGNLIRIIEWPAQSPDLNPIKNLWADVKKKNNKERWADVSDSQNNIPKTVDNCGQIQIKSISLIHLKDLFVFAMFLKSTKVRKLPSACQTFYTRVVYCVFNIKSHIDWYCKIRTTSSLV